MQEIVEKLLQDCSTQDTFLFTVRCSECGQIYSSKAVRFSKAGVPPLTEGKRIVYDAMYRTERKRARDLAVRQAAELFNRCPICGRTVCNRCFLICEDLDMCRSCAARLEESGAPVTQNESVL